MPNNTKETRPVQTPELNRELLLALLDRRFQFILDNRFTSKPAATPYPIDAFTPIQPSEVYTSPPYSIHNPRPQPTSWLDYLVIITPHNHRDYQLALPSRGFIGRLLNPTVIRVKTTTSHPLVKIVHTLYPELDDWRPQEPRFIHHDTYYYPGSSSASSFTGHTTVITTPLPIIHPTLTPNCNIGVLALNELTLKEQESIHIADFLVINQLTQEII